MGFQDEHVYFEVIQKVKLVNEQRKKQVSGNKLVGESCDDRVLNKGSTMALSYIAAPPKGSSLYGI